MSMKILEIVDESEKNLLLFRTKYKELQTWLAEKATGKDHILVELLRELGENIEKTYSTFQQNLRNRRVAKGSFSVTVVQLEKKQLV